MAGLKKRYVVNFRGHLAACEFNYRRLKRLMPGWPCIVSDININPTNNSELNRYEWGYIMGNAQGNYREGEMALTINVKERAKYTTTVHIVVYSRLQNQISWVKYQHSDTDKASASKHDGKFKVQGSSVNTKVSPNGFKDYSLDVRLYHDADVAEVVAWQGHRRFRVRNEYPNPHMYHCDEKAQLNQFLGELLEFCLVQGRVMQDIVMVPAN